MIILGLKTNITHYCIVSKMVHYPVHVFNVFSDTKKWVRCKKKKMFCMDLAEHDVGNSPRTVE